MSNFNPSDLKSQISDLAKPFLFRIHFPANQITDRLPSVLARTAKIPEKAIGEKNIKYFGIDVKMAGNPTFGDWSTDFIVDEAYKIRNIMEAWSNKVFRMDKDGGQYFGTPSEYMGDIIVQQLDGNNDIVAEYTLHMAWPKSIGEIELAHETVDAEEKFTVTFNYTYFTRTK